MTEASTEPQVLHRWSARKLSLRVLVIMILLFAVLVPATALAADSRATVLAMAGTALSSIASVLVAVRTWVDFELTTVGLRKRIRHPRKTKPFEEIFRWDELSRVQPIHHGFKFERPLGDARGLRRFWRRHVSDADCGEFQVEDLDRPRVLALLQEHGVPVVGD